MNIKIIGGKVKSTSVQALRNMLSALAALQIQTGWSEGRASSESLSQAEKDEVMAKEGERILNKISGRNMFMP